MAIVDINVLGRYGQMAVALQLLFGFLFVTAILELCRVEFMAVGTWATIITVWLGLHVFLNWSLLHHRIMYDYNRGNAAVVHHHPFKHHAIITVIVGVVLTTFVWIVYTSHTKANLAVFNDTRYNAGTIPAGLLDIYIQWQNLMTLVIVGFVATTTTFSAFIQRILDPVLRIAEEASTPLGTYGRAETGAKAAY